MGSRIFMVALYYAISLLFCEVLSAQTLLSPAGATFFAEEFNVQWSIGEQEISTDTIDDSFIITQGFNQPLIICNPCTEDIGIHISEEEVHEISDWIFVFPNPVGTQLQLETKITFSGLGYIAILDGTGRVMRLESISEITTDISTRTINVEGYLPGRYYLKIFNGVFSETTSFVKL